MMENNKELIDIQKFTLDFFRNLDCEIKEDNGSIIVNKVPPDFEEHYGKKSPYNFVFEKSNKAGEYIGAGSTLLKSMQDYLDKKGQTSLLRLAIEIDPVKEISYRLRFGNCHIEQAIQKKEYNILKRFTFSSIFQYLNEKERFLNSIFVDKAKVVEFDLSRYSGVEGRKDDVNIGDIKKDHQIAKDELKKILSKITEEIGKKIEEKLEKEISRIKEHYSKNIKEKEEEIDSIQKQIKKAEEQLSKQQNELDKNAFREKIDRFKQQIKDIENSGFITKAKKEEEFLINDEIRKHGLNISNKLINTTIVYYPVFNLTAILKGQGKGHFDVKFNPHSQEMSFPQCRSCSREINEIYLCSSEHPSCKLCLMKCLCCSKEYCRVCVDKKCSACFRDICKKCYARCQNCGKGLCEMHVKKFNNQSSCLACYAQCIGCNKPGLRKNFQKCPSCGSEACDQCSKKIFVKAGLKTGCPRCTQKCDACKRLYPKSEFHKLKTCECDSCNSLTRCKECKGVLCKKVRKQF